MYLHNRFHFCHKYDYMIIIVALGFLYSCQFKNEKSEIKRNEVYDNGIIYSNNIIYDFGKINRNTNNSILFNFVIKNISDSLLTIMDVEPSCSCITINKFSQEVSPNKELSITGKITVPHNEGKINKPIFLRYNKGRILLLRIKGEII